MRRRPPAGSWFDALLWNRRGVLEGVRRASAVRRAEMSLLLMMMRGLGQYLRKPSCVVLDRTQEFVSGCFQERGSAPCVTRPSH